MHLEHSIHLAKSITLKRDRGEHSHWTSFVVEDGEHELEFTAFGELPIAVNVYDDKPITDLIGYLGDLGLMIDGAKAGTLRHQATAHCDVVRFFGGQALVELAAGLAAETKLRAGKHADPERLTVEVDFLGTRFDPLRRTLAQRKEVSFATNFH